MIRLQTLTLSTVIGVMMNSLNLMHIVLLYLVAVNLVTFFRGPLKITLRTILNLFQEDFVFLWNEHSYAM